jgi:hypothetical protein
MGEEEESFGADAGSDGAAQSFGRRGRHAAKLSPRRPMMEERN